MTQLTNGVVNQVGQQQNLEHIRNTVKVTLEQVMGDSSAEMLDEMSTIFLEDAVPLIDQIKTGLANHDYTAIKMAAHALKGSSATIGLGKFADACLAIENSGKNEDDNLIGQYLTVLEVEYSQVQEALTAFLI